MVKKKKKLINLLILGSTGQLGAEIYKVLEKKKNIKILNKKNFRLDFLKKNYLKKKLNEFDPQIIINCAAYTNVELAEKEKNKSKIINAKSLKTISKFCKIKGTILIHFSTDYVFSSNTKKCFDERSVTKPINYYGFTKLLGEKTIKKTMKKFYIFRVSWLYSKTNNNFYTKIKQKILNKKIDKIYVVSDQFGCPLSTKYVADIIYNNINKIIKCELFYGVYHIGTKNYTNWYNFAKYINLKMNYKNKIYKIKSSDLSAIAKRPKYSVLKFRYFKYFVSKKKTWQEIFNNFYNKEYLR